MEKLFKVRELIEELNNFGIGYCHWKSNIALPESLSGQTDIDLLIQREDASLFRTILSQLQFRPAVMTDGHPFPSVEHYYALDENSGILVHVHAYYRVITGESLTKNYHFPIEEMLLKHTRQVDSVQVPVKSAELIVFTLRMMLKHTALVELLLLSRYWKGVRQEIEWLLEPETLDRSKELLQCYLPTIDTGLFSECVEALKTPAPLYRRVILGYRLRSQIGSYARHSWVRTRLDGMRKFMVMFISRFARSQKSMALQTGGAMIAFVGSEASGKSTLLSEIGGWLGEHFTVEQIHVGKPPSSALTFIPNLFLPALRSIFPKARSTKVQIPPEDPARPQKASAKFPLMFAIRSALLAHDRNSLLSRAFSRTANGTVMLCDRYPSAQSGVPDSPQLAHLPVPSSRFSIRRIMAQSEARLYQQIPAPDLIVYLTVPLEVAVRRNAERNKYEPEDYVRQRYSRSANLEFGDIPVLRINTDQPLEQTVLDVKKAIWKAL
jgi:hypothetical protein